MSFLNNLTNNITATLSVSDLEELIRKEVEESGYTVDDLEFVTKESWHGYGAGEYKKTEFSGVKIKLSKGE